MKARLPEDIRAWIVYEDDRLIVANKPSGLLTIKDDKGGENLYHALFDHVLRQGRGKRLFVVHRLDRDTSGLLCFAKDARTKTVLQSCFEAQAVERRYEAVCSGTTIPLNTPKKIVVYLCEDKNRNVHLSSDGKGKRCETEATCLAVKRGWSYLDLSLITGRRNQIRLSLKSLGLPVVGDLKYGGVPSFRMKLNAYRLSFPPSLGLSQRKFEIPKIFEGEFFPDRKRKEEKTGRYDELLASV